MEYNEIMMIRILIEGVYRGSHLPFADFGEILCYEIHSQPINPRMEDGEHGLTFKEIAAKWGITVKVLGVLIADHCERL